VSDVVVRLPEELGFLLPPRDRAAGCRRLRFDPDATVGHVVRAAGVPPTEVGRVRLDGAAVPLTARTLPGSVLEVVAVRRPEPLPAGGLLLDVGLGALARRLRLLGLDAAYDRAADDPALVARAAAEDRVLLTQDRRLLMRRGQGRDERVRGRDGWQGALVRGAGTDEQLADVLDRFAPVLAPLTRCTACGAGLQPVAKEEVSAVLQPGTRRSYDEFSRCPACGRVFWRGAHARRIDALVARARRQSAERPPLSVPKAQV
jgi:uncharacterized protein with PIN domain